MTTVSSMTPDVAARTLDRREFDSAYDRLILENEFVEDRQYYRHYRDRYRRTLEYLVAQPLRRPAKLLEIGGGQIALLCQELFGDHATVGDLNEAYARSVLKHGVQFVKCDLLRDRLSQEHCFDAIILCEVVEHLPVPLHTVLERIMPALRPGGLLLITTPNLYRLRNLVRMMLGRDIFCPLFYPDGDNSLGHVLEFSADHLRWQLERARMENVHVELSQLTNRGSTLRTQALRTLAAPMLRLRPLWRDGLVAWARKPAQPPPVETISLSSDTHNGVAT